MKSRKEVLLKLAAVYDVDITSVKIELLNEWMKQNLENESQLLDFFNLVINQCKYFPVITDCNRLWKTRGESPAIIATRAFLELAPFSRMFSVYITDKVCQETIVLLGGWLKFCERRDNEEASIWLKKEFIEIYSQLLINMGNEIYPRVLTGFSDKINNRTPDIDEITIIGNKERGHQQLLEMQANVKILNTVLSTLTLSKNII